MNNENLPFSQRMGLEKTELQIYSINQSLRNKLWNMFYLYLLEKASNEYNSHNIDEQRRFIHLMFYYWHSFLAEKIDDFPHPLEGNRYSKKNSDKLKKEFKDFFDDSDWDKVYEFIEFMLNNNSEFEEKIDKIKESVNEYLKEENAGYRIVGKKVEPITNQEEVLELETVKSKAEENSTLNGVKSHWQKALECFSQKPHPDIQNTIKESISMVEAIAKVIEPEAKSLGDALTKLEKKEQLHGALKNGFSSIYGYTSDSDGIRHAQGFDDQANLDLEDARYFLVSCSAFTNYLIEKARKQGLL